MPHLPDDRAAKILVISCGPGYLVNMLAQAGYTNVHGIDSDPEKVAHATRRGLRCEAAEAFPFLERSDGGYDVIIPEQELNHLTIAETIEFLQLCHRALQAGRANRRLCDEWRESAGRVRERRAQHRPFLQRDRTQPLAAPAARRLHGRSVRSP